MNPGWPRVEVEWVDSANLFGDGWADTDDLDRHQDEVVCHTAGYLVRENDHAIYVAGSLNTCPSIGSVMQIPRVAIRRTTPLHKEAR